MKLILSPTKTMVFTPEDHGFSLSPPVFEKMAGELILELRPLSIHTLQKLFKTSDALTEKTHDQIHEFETAQTGPALFVFHGDAFKSLAAKDFSPDQLEFAHTHLRIFSGLYGILTPFDAIRPYRLDFNTPLKIQGKSLKQYWKDNIVQYFESLVKQDEYLINLASDEYSQILTKSSLSRNILTFQFREKTNGTLKNLSIRAKQARGQFAKKIIQDRMDDPHLLKQTPIDGYVYSENHSSPFEWFFIR